ncbi:lipoxygenase [Nodosilinea sp. FACHB-131]|uniref:lipoxygenase family protein n=1 Tax=Cyanophyceae TaxID=3028117 RepID=UPI001688D8CE|nr:lipoxygenase family protein [Nodosilinea sp. FACHB-131]MBD1877254.1 lipoxygenase [Nodosilinea sp. FACHB-131]
MSLIRVSSVEQGRNLPSDQKYEYDYERFVNSLMDPDLKYPMVSSVFKKDNSLTIGGWVEQVVTLLLRVRSNQSMYELAIKQNMFSVFKLAFDIKFTNLVTNSKVIRRVYTFAVKHLISENVKTIQNKKISTPVQKTKRDERIPLIALRSPIGLKNYKDLFQVLHLPIIAYQAQEDKAFAAQRIAGPNPLVIERLYTLLDKFPVTDAQYKSVMGSNDSLQKALAESRLYITDYQVLREIAPGTVDIEDHTVQKYIYHPIALFAVEPGDCPNRRFVPVAIQCYQDPSPENPIFLAPSSSSSLGERWAWQMAKLIVQIADGNYHEFVSHLGGTHLRMEPIAIATNRNLPVTHPLGTLLRPHFEGTLFINDSAVKGLVNPGGTVDKVAAGTLKSSLLLSVKGAKDYPYPFNESSLPKVLKARGVDDSKCLPNYPYRDDGLLIWDAILEWVSSYLSLFYTDDTSVQNDAAIQSWIQDLTAPNGGQMTGIGEKLTDDGLVRIQTLTYLIEAVTLIIFTASANHAAVNFPQASFMTYMPNMPLAGYREAPKTTVGISEKDYLDLLPPLCQAESQMNMTYLLGSVYYTRLGNYGDSYFSDNRVKDILKVFHKQLLAIELEIVARNESRSTEYNVLRPSKIPQSINI